MTGRTPDGPGITSAPMAGRLAALTTRAHFLGATDVLVVIRPPPPPAPPAPGQPASVPADPAEGDEILLAVFADGGVVALNGHVDLGTGIRTALAQIVAEELDVPVERVAVVLGDTARVPNQGPTIASASIQIHAEPLRRAAAQAAAWLRTAGSAGGGAAAGGDAAAGGGVPANRFRALAGRRVVLTLDPAAAVKPVADYRIVGRSVARVDIPAKAAGDLVFVHDMRVPGMLHGRVVRPPYAGADHGDFIGNTLESVDESSIAHLSGIRAVVVIRDFVGVVAEREEDAERAAAELVVRWRDWPGLPATDDIEQALKTNPATPRRLIDDGDVDAAIAGSGRAFERTYLWPWQMHASIGPSCALALWHGSGALGDGNGDGNGDGDGHGDGDDNGHRLTVWAGTQNPHVLRADLARLLGLAPPRIELIRMEAAGCYGRNCADDVAADAALLARAVGAPVRVQLTREQENTWDPKGAAQWMTVRGALDDDGSLAAWDFTTSYPSNGAPLLASLLTGSVAPNAQAYEMGDRTAKPPYAAANLRVTVNDMAPVIRASWLRGVSALPNSFAHESWIDEMATAAGVDPVQYRLRHLPDERGRALLSATALKAGWKPHALPMQQPPKGEWLQGQGVAWARYVHSRWPGFGAAWAAWVADVEVNRRTGEVHVARVVVGHDAGLIVNPAGIRHQVQGNVLQTTSRALKEKVTTEPVRHTVANKDWGSYPILNFRDVPVVDVMLMPRPGEPPLGAGESSSVPGTAAIANAIFDATGVRLRQPPFTPEVVRAALNPLADGTGRANQANGADRTAAGMAAGMAAGVAAGMATGAAAGRTAALPATAHRPAGKRLVAATAALAASVVGIGAAVIGWRPAIAPVARPAASIYTAETIERGRVLAAIGNCIGCHTTPDGPPLAGGRRMPTPFGEIVTTNITPDVETGIGSWSFSAFQRAMREGVARDGRHLYPAFPYPSYTRTTDDDLQAIYAWLMSQPAVRQPTPASSLAFPFSMRPLVAGWNALYLQPGAQPVTDPSRSAEWNRGAYLVEGLGHCGGCHTPRHALGAERTGEHHLSGALVEGWEAPALTALSKAPLPWTEADLFDYLRTGVSRRHGIAGGPMAEIVAGLGGVPDSDLRAMANYLASYNPPDPPVAGDAERIVSAAAAHAAQHADALGAPQRLFEMACASCHHDGNGPRVLGANVPLALSTMLHGDRPDNLIRTILDGVQEPATTAIGFMPGFRNDYSDARIAELAAWMRGRFAPEKPGWDDLEPAVRRLRAGQ